MSLNCRPIIRKIYRKAKQFDKNFSRKHCPAHYADILFFERFGRHIDWKHPRDLNEVINYLSFRTDTSLWSQLADKYEVRNYVRKVLGNEDVLIPLIGVWNTVQEIDFDKLPEEYVIKTTCSSGDAILQTKEKRLPETEIKDRLQYSIDTYREFFTNSAEPHYLLIPPRIIAEKMLKSDDGIVDYKIWCVNEEPFGVFTVSDRDFETHYANYAFYDLEWNVHREWLSEEYRNETIVKKPIHLSEMLQYARKLAKGFPEVRVDFYEVEGRVYFGEMTFTSACGRMSYLDANILKKLGELALEKLPELNRCRFGCGWIPV